jgi:hypothetical protein
MFTRLSKESWVTFAVLIVLAIAAVYGDFTTELTIARLRNEGVHTTANVVGTRNFKFWPITSIVEYVIDDGETVSTELVTGQLADQQEVLVAYDPQDPTVVTLASGDRRHNHLVLAFALMVTALFVFILGVENFPRRY